MIVELISVEIYCFDSFRYFHSNIVWNPINTVKNGIQLHFRMTSGSFEKPNELDNKKIKSIIVLPHRSTLLLGVSEILFLFKPKNLSIIFSTKNTTKNKIIRIVNSLTINPLQLSLLVTAPNAKNLSFGMYNGKSFFNDLALLAAELIDYQLLALK